MSVISAFVAFAVAISGCVIVWLERKDKHAKWALGCIAAVGGFTGTILSTVQGLQSDAAIAAAMTRAETAERKADRLGKEVKTLRQKPFSIRLKAFLDEIDPTVFESLAKKERRVFALSLNDGQTSDLNRFANESDGKRLIIVEEGPNGMLAFGNSGGGFMHDVRLTLDEGLPNLVVADLEAFEKADID